MRQLSPRAAGAQHVQNGIHHLAHVRAAWPSPCLTRRNHRFELSPLFIAQITVIACSCHAFISTFVIWPPSSLPPSTAFSHTLCYQDFSFLCYVLHNRLPGSVRYFLTA